MLARCEDPESRSYRNYGRRGITVCPEWHDVAVFIAWIEANLGPRPVGMTLDRWPDNDGNYEPGNVRWATWPEQHANKRRVQIACLPDDLEAWYLEYAAGADQPVNAVIVRVLEEFRERMSGNGTSTQEV